MVELGCFDIFLLKLRSLFIRKKRYDENTFFKYQYSFVTSSSSSSPY